MTVTSFLSLHDEGTTWRDPKSLSVGYFAKGPIGAVDAALLEELRNIARESGENARLSLHSGPEAAFHEMIIYQHADRIHPPKKHAHKDKSFHVMEGKLGVFVFDEAGNVIDACVLDGARRFVYRVAAGVYHADIPITDHVIHHESTTGPFVRASDSIFAPWAPAEGDQAGLAALRARLLAGLERPTEWAPVLLTGAGGLCGSHIARHFARIGRAIVSVARRPLDGAIAADLRYPEGLPAEIGVVIHAAANLGVAGTGAAELAFDNVEATRRLIAHARGAGASRLIFFSAMSVYGRVGAPVVDESTPIVNPDAYGASKLLCEHMLAEVSAELPSVSLRLPSVVGPGARHGWITGIISKLRCGEPVRFVNPDTPFNNLVHVDDLAAFVAQLVDVPLAGADVVTLASSEPMKIGDVVAELKARLGSRSELIAERQADAAAFTIDFARAAERYGWRAPKVGDVIARLADETSA